jgi:RHS repeat-associated protein
MYRDGETGNDYTQFRMYESNLGRWMSPDPLAGDISNPQSLNRYSYVVNNPCNLVDPLGLKCTISVSNLGNRLSPIQASIVGGEILSLLWEYDVDATIVSGKNADFNVLIASNPEEYGMKNVKPSAVAFTYRSTEGGPIEPVGWAFIDRVTQFTGAGRASWDLGTALGRATTQEFGHWAFQSDTHVPRTFMQDVFSGNQWYAQDQNTRNLWGINAKQVLGLWEKCGTRGEKKEASDRSGGNGPMQPWPFYAWGSVIDQVCMYFHVNCGIQPPPPPIIM